MNKAAMIGSFRPIMAIQLCPLYQLRPAAAECKRFLRSDHLCRAARGHSCPQQLLYINLDRFGARNTLTSLLRTGMSARRQVPLRWQTVWRHGDSRSITHRLSACRV